MQAWVFDGHFLVLYYNFPRGKVPLFWTLLELHKLANRMFAKRRIGKPTVNPQYKVFQLIALADLIAVVKYGFECQEEKTWFR